MTKEYDFEATRLAMVNPVTGTEINPAQAAGFDSEKTLLSTPKGVKRLASIKKTEQFIPMINSKNTGEVTNVWVKENGIKMFFETLLNFVLKRIKLILLSCVTVAVSIFVITVFLDKPQKVEVENKSFAKTKVPTLKNVTHGKEIKDVSLNRAVGSLLNGELKESLELYRSLKIKFPDNASYDLAVKILDGSSEK